MDSYSLNQALEALGSYLADFGDLKRLNPNKTELDQAAVWCQTQDVSDEFARDLKEALQVLGG